VFVQHRELSSATIIEFSPLRSSVDWKDVRGGSLSTVTTGNRIADLQESVDRGRFVGPFHIDFSL